MTPVSILDPIVKTRDGTELGCCGKCKSFYLEGIYFFWPWKWFQYEILSFIIFLMAWWNILITIFFIGILKINRICQKILYLQLGQMNCPPHQTQVITLIPTIKNNVAFNWFLIYNWIAIYFYTLVGARSLAGGSTACRNPFDLPTIYSTGVAAQPTIPRRDIYPDSFGGDDRWQNLLEKGNKGLSWAIIFRSQY